MNSNYRMHCGEVWGGIEDADQDLATAALDASLFSRSTEGGKGGDMYYLSVCGADMLTRIAVADVTGHGKTVSDISSWVYKSLKQHLNQPEGDRLVHRLNNKVATRGIEAMTTMTVVGLIVKNGSLYFTYAGHPPMMIRRNTEKTWQPVTALLKQKGCNLPLGVMADTCYIQNETRLESGDQLFIYTDGVWEAPSPEDEPFGMERLTGTLNHLSDASPAGLKRGVLDALGEHTHGNFDHDDMTLMAIQSHID